MGYLTQVLFQNAAHLTPDIIKNYPNKKEFLEKRLSDNLSNIHLMALHPENYQREFSVLLSQCKTTEEKYRLLNQQTAPVVFEQTLCPITMESIDSVNGLLYITENKQIRYLANLETFWGVVKSNIDAFLESEYALGFESSDDEVERPGVSNSTQSDDDWHTEASDSGDDTEAGNEQNDGQDSDDSNSIRISTTQILALANKIDLSQSIITCPTTRQKITHIIPLAILNDGELNLLIKQNDKKLTDFNCTAGKTTTEIAREKERIAVIIETFPSLSVNTTKKALNLKSAIEASEQITISNITQQDTSITSILDEPTTPLLLLLKTENGLLLLKSLFFQSPDLFEYIIINHPDLIINIPDSDQGKMILNFLFVLPPDLKQQFCESLLIKLNEKPENLTNINTKFLMFLLCHQYIKESLGIINLLVQSPNISTELKQEIESFSFRESSRDIFYGRNKLLPSYIALDYSEHDIENTKAFGYR